MERKIPVALVTRIARAYDFHVRDASPVAPSDEAIAWRADAERLLFIHRSPPWRTPEELAWVHTVVGRAARVFPQAIAPLTTTDGDTFVEHDGALITLYPFVEGTHLDREATAQRDAAARLLAELHRVLLTGEVGARPQPSPQSPWSAMAAVPDRLSVHHGKLLAKVTEKAEVQPQVPPELEDRALDEWHAALLRRADLQRGLVHGDYYRRNLLWSHGHVAAVVDWHEARHDVLLAEVASATWEFSKDATSRGFSIERARAFVDAYADAGGPADVRERALVVPLIRWRLREEALVSLALEGRGLPTDAVYREAVTASFNALRSHSL